MQKYEKRRIIYLINKNDKTMNKLISIKIVNDNLGNFDVESTGYCYTGEENYHFPMHYLTREYQMAIITKGSFSLFDKDENEYTMFENNVVLIRPMCKIHYLHHPYCENYWINFFGLEDIIEKYGLALHEINVMRVNDNTKSKIITLINDIITQYQVKQFGYDIYNKQNRLNIILILAKQNHDIISSPFNKEELAKIRPALMAMNNNYQKTLSMDDYAKLCSMSKSSFMHNFSKIMNTTPIKYINSIKMQNAKFLLENSTMSICDISANLGLSSPLYFSDMFFKTYNQRPSFYRKDFNNKN